MTDFLQKSGFLTTPFNLLSSELNTLANGNSALSSVGGTSGVFTQSNWSSAIWGQAYFESGGAFTPTAGGYIAGWFLFSPDGTVMERTVSNTDFPRPPDFIIPLFASAYDSTTSKLSQGSGLSRLPWWSTKIFVVNRSGASLPSSGNFIKIGPVATQGV